MPILMLPFKVFKIQDLTQVIAEKSSFDSIEELINCAENNTDKNRSSAPLVTLKYRIS
jgi:hypothetical protein